MLAKKIRAERKEGIYGQEKDRNIKKYWDSKEQNEREEESYYLDYSHLQLLIKELKPSIFRFVISDKKSISAVVIIWDINSRGKKVKNAVPR